MTKPFGQATISAVILVEEEAPAEFFRTLAQLLHDRFAGFELVLVVNGVDDRIAEQIRQLMPSLPDATAHFLLDRVEPEAARLFGMDNALSDWILLIDPIPAQLTPLPEMLEAALAGADGVIVESGAQPPGGLYDVLANHFMGLTRATIGIAVERNVAPLRLFNRPLGLRIVNDPYGELLVRASFVSGGFRITRLKADYPTPDRVRQIGRGVRRGLGILVRSSGLPLRALSLFSLAIGLLSLLYTAYIVLIYLFKPDVTPGWTTTSLQLATLMVLVSLMFWMIAEYIMAIRAALPPRRRIVVARELRSERTFYSGLLNVIDEEGQSYRLGRNLPQERAPQEQKA